MQSAGYLARQRAGGADAITPVTPAAAILAAVAVRTAIFIRCMAVAYIVVQVAIWHSYYAMSPWRLAAPIAAMTGGAALVTWLARHQPTARLAAADSAVHLPLALSAVWSVPPAMRGDIANWLYILLAGQSVVPMWFAPLALGAPLVLAAGTAYWAGAVLPGSQAAAHSKPGASAILLFAVGTVAWSGYRMLRRRAAAADAALAEADAEEHEQYVALSRNTERREHERLLHDTVLNTLTALGRGDTAGGTMREVVARCQHDVTLIEYVLGGSGQGGAALAPGAGRGGIVAALEAVCVEMRARGLDVHVQVTPAGQGSAAAEAADPGRRPGPAPAAGPADRRTPVRIPVPVVQAVARAVREALANVARHAGVGQAWLEVRMGEPGPGTGDDGGLVVTVRDRGTGFDPGRVGSDRFGVRRSIAERLADCGGSASVQSTPGVGTTVTLCWPVGTPGRQAGAAGLPAAGNLPRDRPAHGQGPVTAPARRPDGRAR